MVFEVPHSGLDSRCSWIALLAALLVGLPSPAAEGPPSKADASDWAKVQARMAQKAYAFAAAAGGGVQAVNREQGIVLRASDAGLELRRAHGSSSEPLLRLTARAMGRGAQAEALASSEPSAAGQRVEYRRGGVVEWYENRPEGLELGFTVLAAPPGRNGEVLALELEMQTPLAVRVAEGGQGFVLAEGGDAAAWRMGRMKVTDAAGRALAARFALRARAPGRQRVALLVDDAGAPYPITVDPLLSKVQSQLGAADGAAGDRFAAAVSVKGDVLVVGAPGADFGGSTDQGAAYVFLRNAAGADQWGEELKLTVVDGAAADGFGGAVSVDGDVIAVGARWATVGTNAGQGVVYVFERDAGGVNAWGRVARLTASDGAGNDQFGGAVAVDGDAVYVGAATAGAGTNAEQGAVYVFARNAGATNGWGEICKITAPDGAGQDHLGEALAAGGNALAVGAPRRGSGQGAIYLFERGSGPSNAWAWVRTLTAEDGAAEDGFGGAVGLSGGLLAAGAPGAEEGTNLNQGAIYVFQRDAGGTNAWGQVAKLHAAGGAAEDGFGHAVAVAGDVVLGGGTNRQAVCAFSRYTGGAESWGQVREMTSADTAAGDGFGAALAADGDAIVVGAPQRDSGVNADQGRAYVFAKRFDDWPARGQAVASDGAANDQFGTAVAAWGDVMVVGAPYRHNGSTADQGAAYVFARDARGTNAWGEVARLLAADGTTNDQFGFSVAAWGDVVAVGAPYHAVGTNAAQGAAYVFERDAGGTNAWGQVAELSAMDGGLSDHFGWSVGANGDVVVVGAPDHNRSNYLDQGAAYVFERDAGGTNAWGQVGKLVASDGLDVDRFGWSVAAAGDVIAVGAEADNVGTNNDQGSAYVFARQAGGADTWGEVRHLVASDGAAADLFGYSVAVAGDVLVVGAAGDDVGGKANQGSAYVYERDAGGAGNWGEVRKLLAPDGAPSDLFGYAVAAAGDGAVVGARYHNISTNSHQGSAYVFARRAGGIEAWSMVRELVASDGRKNDEFGYSVASAGAAAAASAAGDDVGANANQGSVSLFEGAFLPDGDLTAWTDGHGTIAPSGTVRVAYGDDASFAIGSGPYYHIDRVLTNQTSIPAAHGLGEYNCVWTEVAASGTVYAAFAPDLAALGTPHWWLALYGLTNSGLSFDESETNDADGDIAASGDEYVADTDPTNSLSVFRITGISNGTALAVGFESSSNRVYTLEFQTNLLDVLWTNLPDQTRVVGSNGPMTLTDTNASEGARFYRLKAGLP